MPDPAPLASDRHWTIALAVIALVAFAVRLAALLDLRASLFLTTLIGDSLQFDVLARRILAGECADSGQYYQGALYPYFVALVYGTLGDDPLATAIATDERHHALTQCELGHALAKRLDGAGDFSAG